MSNLQELCVQNRNDLLESDGRRNCIIILKLDEFYLHHPLQKLRMASQQACHSQSFCRAKKGAERLQRIPFKGESLLLHFLNDGIGHFRRTGTAANVRRSDLSFHQNFLNGGHQTVGFLL